MSKEMISPNAILGFFFLVLVIVIPIIIREIRLKRQIKKYEETTYFKNTGVPYQVQNHDLGRHGEYLTYECLKSFESESGRFLFNVYIPKKNGETTELDVILITRKGIFVVESKNYSGWIFGNDTNRYWTQCLQNGRNSQKEHFYNPVMQNRSHIRHLRAFLNEDIPIYSIIAFSDRCTFKDVTVHSDDVRVIHRNQLCNTVEDLYKCQTATDLSDSAIDKIIISLLPYSNVSEEVKKRHIENILGTTAKSAPVTPAILTITPEEIPAETCECKTVPIENPGEKTIDETDSEPVKPEDDHAVPKDDNICPLCGSKLVVRTARYGARAGKQFYGCTSYPECTYMKNID